MRLFAFLVVFFAATAARAEVRCPPPPPPNETTAQLEERIAAVKRAGGTCVMDLLREVPALRMRHCADAPRDAVCDTLDEMHFCLLQVDANEAIFASQYEKAAALFSAAFRDGCEERSPALAGCDRGAIEAVNGLPRSRPCARGDRPR